MERKNITTSQIRVEEANMRGAKLKASIDMATRLKNEGHTNKYISYVMGINESTVINLLNYKNKEEKGGN